MNCRSFICLLLIIILAGLRLHGQQRTGLLPDSISIYPDLQDDVEKYIRELNIEELPLWVYSARLFTTLYEKGPVISTKDSAEMWSVFNSVYYWENDTLVIQGLYGIETGYGFIMRMRGSRAKLDHLLIDDEKERSYSHTEDGALAVRLEVPCNDVQIILNELPDSMSTHTIYGYVKFKSQEYYELKWYGANHRVKARRDMKIYFRSDFKPGDEE